MTGVDGNVTDVNIGRIFGVAHSLNRSGGSASVAAGSTKVIKKSFFLLSCLDHLGIFSVVDLFVVLASQQSLIYL
jgi:hypothetical protein